MKNKLVLKIKKLVEDAKIPTYAHTGDAGLDFFAYQTVTIKPGESHSIKTGIAVEIPESYVGLVWDKSGLSMNHGLKVLGGVIDSSFRGEVVMSLFNLSQKEYTLEKGQKIAQMIIQKFEEVIVNEVEELSETSRGEEGFGSTGK